MLSVNSLLYRFALPLFFLYVFNFLFVAWSLLVLCLRLPANSSIIDIGKYQQNKLYYTLLGCGRPDTVAGTAAIWYSFLLTQVQVKVCISLEVTKPTVDASIK